MRITRKKDVDFLQNAQVVKGSEHPVDPEPVKEATPISNAERVALAIQEQRTAFNRVGVTMNLEGLIEADFLIRRNILDKLLDPRHEIDKECGYPADITPTMYHLMFERHGLSRRVVEVWPKESWAVDPEVFETEDLDETEFELAWQALVKRLNIWHVLQRADILSGIGRFGVLLLGLADGKDMSEPVDGIDEMGNQVGNPKNDLLFLRVFDETVCRVNMRESNVNNPRFGKPTVYTLTFKDLDITELAGSGVATVGDVTKRVHWSRVIHLADNREMSEVYGAPRMKAVFNRLMDARKILGGSGEMFWAGAFPGISFELSPGVGDAELDMDSIKAEMARYQSGLQRYIALTGMSAKSLAPQISDPTAHIDKILEEICITLGVPKRVFMGSEQAQLASSQDARTWNRRINERNTKYVSPMVIRPFVDRLIAIGVLPRVEEYEIFWPDLNTLTDSEKTDVAVKKTQALSTYVSGGVDQILPPDQFLEMIMEIDPEKVDEIMKALEEYHEIEEQPPAGAEKIAGENPVAPNAKDGGPGIAPSLTDELEDASSDQAEKP